MWSSWASDRWGSQVGCTEPTGGEDRLPPLRDCCPGAARLAPGFCLSAGLNRNPPVTNIRILELLL